MSNDVVLCPLIYHTCKFRRRSMSWSVENPFKIACTREKALGMKLQFQCPISLIFFSLTLAIYLYLEMKSFLMTRLKLTYLCDIISRHCKVMVNLNDCKTDSVKQFGDTNSNYWTHNFFPNIEIGFWIQTLQNS